MLDLDLDLEADLGIDTVKQAETFAAIREAYGIPRDEALKLRDFPTLAHVIRFVKERLPRPEGRAGGRRPRPPLAPATPGADEAAIRERVLAIVAEKTGYPPDMLDARPRPRGRPRHRHREAGRDLRGHPRGLGHPARRDAQAARLPDPRPRHPLREGAPAEARGRAGGALASERLRPRPRAQRLQARRPRIPLAPSKGAPRRLPRSRVACRPPCCARPSSAASRQASSSRKAAASRSCRIAAAWRRPWSARLEARGVQVLVAGSRRRPRRRGGPPRRLVPRGPRRTACTGFPPSTSRTTRPGWTSPAGGRRWRCA